MSLVEVRDLKINDEVDGLGYLVAITPSMYQQEDGTVISYAGVTLYFRSRPFSFRGKIRGTDKGLLECNPQDSVLVVR